MGFSLDQPSNRAAEIVTPLLDMPGRIANAWNKPMINGSFQAAIPAKKAAIPAKKEEPAGCGA